MPGKDESSYATTDAWMPRWTCVPSYHSSLVLTLTLSLPPIIRETGKMITKSFVFPELFEDMCAHPSQVGNACHRREVAHVHQPDRTRKLGVDFGETSSAVSLRDILTWFQSIQ